MLYVIWRLFYVMIYHMAQLSQDPYTVHIELFISQFTYIPDNQKHDCMHLIECVA